MVETRIRTIRADIYFSLQVGRVPNRVEVFLEGTSYSSRPDVGVGRGGGHAHRLRRRVRWRRILVGPAAVGRPLQRIPAVQVQVGG